MQCRVDGSVAWRRVRIMCYGTKIKGGLVLKPKLSESGRKILWAAVRAIEKYPRTFSIHDWISHNPRIKGENPYCGTVACIAGHIVLQVLDKAPEDYLNCPVPSQYRRSLGESATVDTLATKILGADFDSTDMLFTTFKYHGKKITSQNVRDRVKEWLRTGDGSPASLDCFSR